MLNINFISRINLLCVIACFLFSPKTAQAQCDDDDTPPSVSVSASPVGCSGGSVTLTFDFDDDDEAHDITWRVGSGPQRTSSGVESGHTENITVTTSTTVTVISIRETDDQDCVSNPNSSINITTGGGLSLSSPTVIQPSCSNNDGSITVNANGGTAPFRYSLGGGAFQSGNTFSGLTSGTYSITAQDNSNCEVSQSVTLNAANGATLSAPTVTQPSSGNNGSIIVNASGGTAPLSYRLNGGAFQTSNTFSGLGDGTYSITVRDASNCESSQTATLTASNNSLTLSAATLVQPTCGNTNGSITVNATGGTAPLSYRLNAGIFQGNNVFSGLNSGNYTIIVRDANGNEATQSITLTATGGNLSGNVSASSVGCGGGSVTVTFTFPDNTENYDITWSVGGVAQMPLNSIKSGHQVNLNIATSTTISLETVGITDDDDDDDSCLTSVNTSTTVTVPTGATLAAPTLTQPSCGGSNGSITVNTTGGTTPLSYRLNTGSFQGSNIFTGLASGSYTITVRDGSNCETSQTVSLNSTAGATLAAPTLTQPACGGSNGSITVNASGGTAPLSYRLNTGSFQGSNIFTGLTSGSYTITVRDGSSCETSQTVSLTGNNFSINTTTTQPNCQNQGSITVVTNGGTSPFTFSINGGVFQGNATFSNLPQGTYTIISRDGAGCEASLQVSILAANINLAAASINKNTDNTLCKDEQITLSANLPNGATGVWSSSDTSATVSTPNQPNTGVKFLKEIDKIVLKWTLSGVNCPNYSTDSIVFKISKKPIAVDDIDVRVEKDKILTFDVSANDEKMGNWRTTIIQDPKQGVAVLSNNGQLTYTPNTDANGSDTLLYTICTDICATTCDTAVVIIRNRNVCDLTAPDNVFPQGITPNGDDKNQSLRFQIVDERTCPFLFARSDIQIFNRWGDRVFKSEPYNNDWSGKNESGNDLPVGVYYYVLRIKLGEPDKPYVKFGSVTVFR